MFLIYPIFWAIQDNLANIEAPSSSNLKYRVQDAYGHATHAQNQHQRPQEPVEEPDWLMFDIIALSEPPQICQHISIQH